MRIFYMSVELFIATKYLKGRVKNLFGLLTTVIAVAGVTLGVAALIVTLAVMSGFHEDIRTKILGLNPHITIFGNLDKTEEDNITKSLSSIKEITSAAPFVYGQVILKSKSYATGVLLKGIDFTREKNVVPIEKILARGRWENLTGRKNIILGKELSRNLAVDIGDDIIMVSPGGEQFLPSGIPKMDKFTVTGIFDSGMYEYDENLAYVDIDNGKRFFNTGRISGLGVKLKNIDSAVKISGALKKIILARVITWEELNKNLFAALKLEKTMMFLLLTLIILVACFNIISNLVLLTAEKAKEIGILTALGMKAVNIRRIFLYEGLMIGWIGTILGTVLGVVLSLIVKKYQFVRLPADIYYIETLPVKLSAGDIVAVVLVAMVITLLATIYPAHRASKLNPVEVIRYG